MADANAALDAQLPQPRRRWVALLSTPRILDAESERAHAMANNPRATAELDLDHAPRRSHLVLHPRIFAPCDPATAQPSAYVLAADRLGGLLFRVTKPGTDEGETMYLCSARHSKAIALPAPRVALPTGGVVEPQPRRSVGLIAVPRQGPGPVPRGHYLVAKLSPRTHDDNVLCFSTTTLESVFVRPLRRLVAKLGLEHWTFRGDNLFCFSTANAAQGWFMKPLHTTPAVRMRNLCGEAGVFAHAGKLYWINLAYGIFFCDPFAEPSRLRFVPLPDGCQVWEEEELSENVRANVALHRRVAPSEGHLRYVEILGVDYDAAPGPLPVPLNPRVRMWTLADPEAAEPSWTFEADLEARLSDVWLDQTYINFQLTYMEVSHVAFVDPNNHRVVYLLQGNRLYGLDLRAKQVVSVENCPERDDREIMLRNSRPIIDAWKWSPTQEELNNNHWVMEQFDSWLARM